MAHRKTSLSSYKFVLVTLISSLAITGVSYLDEKIWNFIMLIFGMLAYSVVGLLFSIGMIHGKNAGRESYAFVFIILIILGYCVYNGIKSLQNWVLSWPLYVKIMIPTILLLTVVIIVIMYILKKRKQKPNEIDSSNDENT